MILSSRSQLLKIDEFPLADGVGTFEEGTVMVATYDTNGDLKVKPSTGAAGDGAVIGLAYNEQAVITEYPSVEEFTITGTAPQDFTIAHTPSAAPATRVTIAGAAATVQTNKAGVNAAGEYFLSGTTLTVQGTANQKVVIQYQYSPTVADLNELQGDTWPSRHVSQVLESVGVVRSGLVYTSLWDTSVSWATSITQANIRGGAGGLLTIHASTGSQLDGAVVHQFPTEDDVLLGIEF